MLAAVNAPPVFDNRRHQQNWMVHYRFDFYLGIFSKCRVAFDFHPVIMTIVFIWPMPVESLIEGGVATFFGGEFV